VLQDGVLYDPNKGQGHKGLKKVTKWPFLVCLVCQYACNRKTNGEFW